MHSPERCLLWRAGVKSSCEKEEGCCATEPSRKLPLSLGISRVCNLSDDLQWWFWEAVVPQGRRRSSLAKYCKNSTGRSFPRFTVMWVLLQGGTSFLPNSWVNRASVGWFFPSAKLKTGLFFSQRRESFTGYIIDSTVLIVSSEKPFLVMTTWVDLQNSV